MPQSHLGGAVFVTRTHHGFLQVHAEGTTVIPRSRSTSGSSRARGSSCLALASKPTATGGPWATVATCFLRVRTGTVNNQETPYVYVCQKRGRSCHPHVRRSAARPRGRRPTRRRAPRGSSCAVPPSRRRRCVADRLPRAARRRCHSHPADVAPACWAHFTFKQSMKSRDLLWTARGLAADPLQYSLSLSLSSLSSLFPAVYKGFLHTARGKPLARRTTWRRHPSGLVPAAFLSKRQGPSHQNCKPSETLFGSARELLDHFSGPRSGRNVV
jgi:hypothetical protein